MLTIANLQRKEPVLHKAKSKLSVFSREALLDDYRKGVKVRIIAKRFGVSRQRVCQIAKEAGVEMRRPGFNAGRPKKTEQERFEAGRRKHLPEQLERARLRHLHLVREAKRLGMQWLLGGFERDWE